MAGNPLVPQGNINRLRASVVFGNNQALNLVASFLGTEGISLGFQNDAGLLLPTLTGGVTSPEPYQLATVGMHIVKSTFMSAVYKAQFESNVAVGPVLIIPDTSTLPNYQLSNCILQGVGEMSFAGRSADFMVRLLGIYYINQTLWDTDT